MFIFNHEAGEEHEGKRLWAIGTMFDPVPYSLQPKAFLSTPPD